MMQSTIIFRSRFYILTMLVSMIATNLFAQEIKDSITIQSKYDIDTMFEMIDRTIDSNFIYKYSQTKYVPPNDQTLLIMGQTVEGITEYRESFPNAGIPAGFSAYWGVPEFKGITESYKNDTRTTQNHQMLVDSFPNTVIQSAMWMVGTWNVAKYTANGDYDKVIKKYIKWAKSVNRPIYLRIGYEFDGIHNELDPIEYVNAYKHIVDLFRSKNVENVAFVWHSYASKPYKDYSISSWYPGDNYVDWVGISVFSQAYNGKDFGVYCDNVLEFAKQKKKPVMIAESSPINGIDKNNINAWNSWFVNFFSFCYNKNIKAISFINEDWTQLQIAGISEWKDSRLSNNKLIANAWFKETHLPRYLKQSPELFELLGYKMD